MINPATFVPGATVMDSVFDHLKAAGFDVYLPETATGDVGIDGRVIIKPLATSKIQDASSTNTYFYIICYIPSTNFELLEPYVKSVKESMKDLFPMIIPTYDETAPYNDPDVHGWMVSITYVNHKKI